MGNYRITVSVDNKPEFDRVFKRVDAQLSDLTEVWEEVKDEFWEIEKEQFQSGGTAGAGGKWKPLSKKYEAQKINKYGTFALLAGILYASTDLYKSMTGKTKDTILDIKKDSIAVGSSLKYAKFHQRGGGRLPKREVISFSDKQKQRLQKRIQKKMVQLMKKQGVPVE